MVAELCRTFAIHDEVIESDLSIGMIQPKEGKIVFAGEACFDIDL
jgi:hypothetical protein